MISFFKAFFLCSTLVSSIGIAFPPLVLCGSIQGQTSQGTSTKGRKAVYCGGFAASPIHSYRVINTYPHDRGAFTQGLVFEDGLLLEGTGRYGRSSLRKVELATGNILKMIRLPRQYFGEGVTAYGNRVIQLTWKSNVGFIYRKRDLRPLGKFYYKGQGWGITHDGLRLIMSDGTSILRFLDPFTFEELGRVEVTDRGVPLINLNELEYVRGRVYANLWGTDCIVVIDPGTGWVQRWISLDGLLDREEGTRGTDVLNGIAYDAGNDRIFVTGKLWPRLFEIQIRD